MCRKSLIGIVVFLTYALSSLQAGLAQNSGGGGGAGAHWKITLTAAGSTVMDIKDAAGNHVAPFPMTDDWGWATQTSYNPSDIQPVYDYNMIKAQQSIDVWSVGTIYISCQWVDYYDNPIQDPPPPAKLQLRRQVSASWIAYVNLNGVVDHAGVGGISDNGLGDPCIPNVTGGTSSGAHLKEYDSSSGLVMDRIDISAIAPVDSFNIQPDANESWIGAGGAVVQCEVAQADHMVLITTPHDNGAVNNSGNFSKGANGQPLENMRADDGSLTVDAALNPVSILVNGGQDSETHTPGWALNPSNSAIRLQGLAFGFDLSTNGFGYYDYIDAQWTRVSVPDWVEDAGYPKGECFGLHHDILGEFYSPFTPDIHSTPITFKLQVTDLRSEYSGATAANIYTIRLHYPDENAQKTGLPAFDHYEAYDWTENVLINQPVTVSMVSNKVKTVTATEQANVQNTATFISGILGSGAICLIPGLSEASTLGILSDISCNATGWAIVSGIQPEPNQTVQAQISTGDMDASAQQQQLINSGSANYDNLQFPDEARIIGLSPAQVNQFLSDASFKQHVLNYATITARTHAGVRYNNRHYTTDSYGDRGYTGQKTYLATYLQLYTARVNQFNISSVPDF